MTWQNRIVGHDNVPPDQLLAHPDNWRVHPKYQQEALRGVINDIGYIKSVTVNKLTGRVVDGHLRVTLALRDGIPTIPVEYVELTEAEEAEALLTLDPIAALAGSDKDNLETLLKQVNTDDAAVMKLLEDTAADAGLDIHGEPKDAEPQIDRAAELLEKWQVKTGDLWQIGEHRLICGDCTDAAVVGRVMRGEKAQMAFTSPPYAEQRKEQYGGVSVDKYVKWFDSVQRNTMQLLDERGSFFINIKPHCDNGQRVYYVLELVLQMIKIWGWLFIDEFCWERKGYPGGWDNRLKNGFEPVYHFSKSKDVYFFIENETEQRMQNTHYFGSTKNKSGLGGTVPEGLFGVRPSNVVKVETGEVNIGTQSHPATFPIRLPEFFINIFSPNGAIVYEPFSGSGTTLVACQNLGRRGRAVEISPAYCAVTLERMAQAFPGIEIKRL